MHRTFRCLVLMTVAASLLAGPASAELGDILHTIPCAGANTGDLAWVDGELYQVIFAPTEERNIYRLDPETGTVLGIVPYAGGSPQGLAYDGHNLWQVCITGDCIYKMHPLTGEVRDTLDAPGGANGQPIGLGWDGESLWLGDSRDPEKIWEMDTLGVALGQFPAPGDSPYGLAWAEGFIWVSDNNLSAAAYIYKMDPETGDILDSFVCPGGGGSPNGIAHDGDCLWIAVNTNDMIYKVDDGIAGASVDEHLNVGVAPVRIVSAWTDPLAQTVDLQLMLASSGEVRAVLFDVLGRQGVPSVLRAAQAGPCALRLDATRMSSGIAYVRVENGGAVTSGKVLVVR